MHQPANRPKPKDRFQQLDREIDQLHKQFFSSSSQAEGTLPKAAKVNPSSQSQPADLQPLKYLSFPAKNSAPKKRGRPTAVEKELELNPIYKLERGKESERITLMSLPLGTRAQQPLEVLLSYQRRIERPNVGDLLDYLLESKATSVRRPVIDHICTRISITKGLAKTAQYSIVRELYKHGILSQEQIEAAQCASARHVRNKMRESHFPKTSAPQ